MVTSGGAEWFSGREESTVVRNISTMKAAREHLRDSTRVCVMERRWMTGPAE